MKLTKILLLSTMVLGSIAVPSIANAADGDVTPTGIEATNDTPATAKTTGEFEVKAGKLTLDAAPDYNFGAHDIIDIIKDGASLDQIDNTVKNDAVDDHNTDTGLAKTTDKLQVTDYRGAGSVWDLKAEMTPFTNTSKDNAGTVDGVITLTGLNEGAEIGSTSSTVWDSATAATDGQASKDVEQKTGAKLGLSNATGVQAGVYDATITWTLENTAAQTAQLG